MAEVVGEMDETFRNWPIIIGIIIQAEALGMVSDQ
jgi:hypothetical protein